MTHDVRRLRPDDADAFAALRREALTTTPQAFASSPEDDRAADLDWVRAQLAAGDHNVTFGAFVDGELVGCAGLVREEKRKMAHRAFLWGMYVRDSARGRGLGAALLDAAVSQARAIGVRQVNLCVVESAASARRLYERAGFTVWGTEPDALDVDGRLLAEHHMVLVL